jgi:hypothetical protein
MTTAADALDLGGRRVLARLLRGQAIGYVSAGFLDATILTAATQLWSR